MVGTVDEYESHRHTTLAARAAALPHPHRALANGETRQFDFKSATVPVRGTISDCVCVFVCVCARVSAQQHVRNLQFRLCPTNLSTVYLAWPLAWRRV